MRDIGFLVLINHGYTKEQVNTFLETSHLKHC